MKQLTVQLGKDAESQIGFVLNYIAEKIKKGSSGSKKFPAIWKIEETMELSNYEKAEQAKATLKELGYYVDNLWQIEDVKGHYDCTDEEAYSILNDVLNSDRIKSEINETIDIEAEAGGLEKKEHEEE
jgi:hypothetical protein